MAPVNSACVGSWVRPSDTAEFTLALLLMMMMMMMINDQII